MNPELETLALTTWMGTSDIKHIFDLPRWHLLSAVWGDGSPPCCRILSIDGHCWSYRPSLHTPGGWETSRVLLLCISEATSRCPGGGGQLEMFPRDGRARALAACATLARSPRCAGSRERALRGRGSPSALPALSRRSLEKFAAILKERPLALKCQGSTDFQKPPSE